MANGANLTAIITAAGSLLGSVTPSLLNHSTASTTIENYMTAISASISNPAVVAQEATAIMSVPNAPVEVTMIASQVAQNASNPAVVLSLMARMSSILSSTNSSIFSHITSYTAGTSTSGATITLG